MSMFKSRWWGIINPTSRLLAKLILQEEKAPKVRGRSAGENPVLM